MKLPIQPDFLKKSNKVYNKNGGKVPFWKQQIKMTNILLIKILTINLMVNTNNLRSSERIKSKSTIVCSFAPQTKMYWVNQQSKQEWERGKSAI